MSTEDGPTIERLRDVNRIVRDERDAWKARAERARAERDALKAELAQARKDLGEALSVPTLGEARAEIGGLRIFLEQHQRGAAEARRDDDIRYAAIVAERNTLSAELAEAKEAYLAVIEAAELRGKVRHLEQELAEATAAIERVHKGLTGALVVWEAEREYHRDRAARKGYSHDETAAEVYGHAIKVVTAAVAALDAPQRPEDTREETGRG